MVSGSRNKSRKLKRNTNITTNSYRLGWPASEESMNRRLIRLDSRIKNQFDLISSRTTWLLTSHAFLFAAFVTLAKESINISQFVGLMRILLLFVIALAGVITCILISNAITAAYSAVHNLKILRKNLLEIAFKEYGYENTEPSADITVKGDLPPKVMPRFMLIIWLLMISTVIFNIGYNNDYFGRLIFSETLTHVQQLQAN